MVVLVVVVVVVVTDLLPFLLLLFLLLVVYVVFLKAYHASACNAQGATVSLELGHKGAPRCLSTGVRDTIRGLALFVLVGTPSTSVATPTHDSSRIVELSKPRRWCAGQDVHDW